MSSTLPLARICLLCFFYRSVFQEIIGTHHANLSRDLELIHPNNNLLELSMKSCVCIYVYSKHIIANQRIAHAAKRRIVSCSLCHFPGKQSTIFTIILKNIIIIDVENLLFFVPLPLPNSEPYTNWDLAQKP